MLAKWIVDLAFAYLAIGGVVAVLFVAIGIDQIDPSAERAYAFRPLVLPGAVLLWPFVAWRWRMLLRQRS